MLRLLILVAALACSACLAAEDSPGHMLAYDRTETAAAGEIRLTSAAFSDGGNIPERFSAYGEGVSPSLNWSGVPAEAVSLVVMVEDPDAVSVKPFLHWAAWNIDPRLGGLPEGIGAGPLAGPLASIVQGRNNRGKTGYFGPRPRGSKPHRYHFQVFALDRNLALRPGATRSELIAALAGHVLAKGRLVGLFRAPG